MGRSGRPALALTMKLPAKNLLFGAGLAAAATLLGGCGGYVEGGGGAVVVDDYYGPGYGGPMFYGHPGYRADSHVASPPRQAWHGGGARSAPAQHSAPSGGDRDRK